MKKFTGEQIEKAKGLLKELKPVPSEAKLLSKQEAVNVLKKEIKDAQAKGYTISEIAGQLTAGGLEISGATLKSYMGRGGKKKSPANTKKNSPAASNK